MPIYYTTESFISISIKKDFQRKKPIRLHSQYYKKKRKEEYVKMKDASISHMITSEMQKHAWLKIANVRSLQSKIIQGIFKQWLRADAPIP